jgi:hypothetical protein
MTNQKKPPLNNELPTAKDRAEAMFALYTTQGSITPEGPPPSQEELALLVDDQLDFSRKQQVYSYINADRSLMKQWLDIIDAHKLLQPQPEHRKEDSKQASGLSQLFHSLSTWLTPARGAMAGGVCAGVLAVVLLNQPQPDLSPEMLPPVSSPEFASQAGTQVEAGIRYGLIQAFQQLSKQEQQSLGLSIPTTVTPSDHTQAVALGYALLDALRQCQQDSNWQPSPLLQAQLSQQLPEFLSPPPTKQQPSTQFCVDLTTYTTGLLTVQ